MSSSAAFPIRLGTVGLALAALLCLSLPAHADNTVTGMAAIPFDVEYVASYRGVKAQGRGTFEEVSPGVYEMRTSVDLRLLGKSLTRVDELSIFLIDDGRIVPQHYRYEQSGLGSRSRVQDFDSLKREAHYSDHKGYETTIALDGPIMDELNALLYLRSELAQGAEVIEYEALDKDRIREFRFEVTGAEKLSTDEGTLDTVIVERIREGSDRQTTMWFAPDHHFVLVKLEQVEPGERPMQMLLKNARVGGQAIFGD